MTAFRNAPSNQPPPPAPFFFPSHIPIPRLTHTPLSPANSKGQYGQDIFTLRSTYFERHPQAPIHMHWRRFKVADIPLATLEDFHAWLMARWNEKEALLAEHAKTGRFPSSINHGESITTEVKLGRWWEIGQLGAVLGPLFVGIFGVWRFIGG